MINGRDKIVWTAEGRPLYTFVNEVLDELNGTKTDFEVKMEGGHILRFTVDRKKPWWNFWRKK